MPRFLRFLLYDDPSRQTYSHLHTDLEVDDAPALAYGDPIRAGDEAVDPKMWPVYIVAHMVHIRQEPDPQRPGKNQIIYEVYLARQDQWPLFELPNAFEQIDRDNDEIG